MIWVELLVVSMGKAEEAVKLIHILAVIWDPNEISEPLFKTIRPCQHRGFLFLQ